MTANFDRWEVDPFFSAAEEVQASADRMESAYRRWMRARSVPDSDPSAGVELSNSVDFRRRELQIALGTAKWQLDEFEGAVKSSYSVEDTDASGRHNQFIGAIKNQINAIEKGLHDSIIKEEGKKGLRWVQLDDQEKDDLASFLCGSYENDNFLEQQSVNDTEEEMVEVRFDDPPVLNRRDLRDCCDVNGASALDVKGFKDTVLINTDSKFVVEIAEQKVTVSQEDLHTGGSIDGRNGNRNSSSAGADFGAWKIIIADDDVENKYFKSHSENISKRWNLWGLINNVGLSAKLKWSKSGPKRWKDGIQLHSNNEHLKKSMANGAHRANLGINTWSRVNREMINDYDVSSDNISDDKELYGWTGAVQRKMQRSQYFIQYCRPVQITSALLATLCLVGLFTFLVT